MLSHLFHKTVKASVILGLRDGAALHEQIQRVLLLQKELMVLLLRSQGVPSVSLIEQGG